MPSTTDEGTTIRPAASTDAASIAKIYNHYIAETIVTFEEEPVTASEIARRIEEVRSASLPWLVAEEGGRVVGYAYATRWKTRERVSLLRGGHGLCRARTRGARIGSKLYGELFPMLKTRGIHAVIGGIALPNEASVALHEKSRDAKSRPLRGGGVQVRPVDRRRILAASPYDLRCRNRSHFRIGPSEIVIGAVATWPTAASRGPDAGTPAKNSSSAIRGRMTRSIGPSLNACCMTSSSSSLAMAAMIMPWSSARTEPATVPSATSTESRNPRGE